MSFKGEYTRAKTPKIDGCDRPRAVAGRLGLNAVQELAEMLEALNLRVANHKYFGDMEISSDSSSGEYHDAPLYPLQNELPPIYKDSWLVELNLRQAQYILEIPENQPPGVRKHRRKIQEYQIWIKETERLLQKFFIMEESLSEERKAMTCCKLQKGTLKNPGQYCMGCRGVQAIQRQIRESEDRIAKAYEIIETLEAKLKYLEVTERLLLAEKAAGDQTEPKKKLVTVGDLDDTRKHNADNQEQRNQSSSRSPVDLSTQAADTVHGEFKNAAKTSQEG